MRDRNSTIPLETKEKENIWDSIEDVADVITMSRKHEWSWALNPECKYINVRIDMRDGGCIISNDHKKRIDPKDLKYQYKRRTAPQNNLEGAGEQQPTDAATKAAEEKFNSIQQLKAEIAALMPVIDRAWDNADADKFQECFNKLRQLSAI